MKFIVLAAVLLAFLAAQTGCAAAGDPGVERDQAAPGRLRGIALCIDPGHQAKADPSLEPVSPGSDEMKARTTAGTSGIVTGIAEYEFNLELGLMLQELLEREGALVVMTRTSHDVSLSNIERAQLANDIEADLFIRIHADSADDSSIRGVSVLYPGEGNILNKDVPQASRKAAESVLDSIMKRVKPPAGRIVEREDITGFNWSGVPTILVEAGFMSNPDDDRLLADKQYRLSLAKSIVEGVIEYFKGMKKANADLTGLLFLYSVQEKYLIVSGSPF